MPTTVINQYNFTPEATELLTFVVENVGLNVPLNTFPVISGWCMLVTEGMIIIL